MAKKAPILIYLVQQQVEEALPEEFMDEMGEIDEDLLDEIKGSGRSKGWAPLLAFTNQSRAEAFCSEKESEWWQKQNPFAEGKSISDWSSFDQPRFLDWLLDAGLEIPKKKSPSAKDWQSWWTKHSKKMTALQRAKVMEALDKVRHYKVVALKD